MTMCIKTQPKISIVIVSFNCKEELRECLKNLLAENSGGIETIVVDNASTDSTLEALQRLQFRNLHVIVNKENIGFAKACNQGARVSKGEFLLFLNPDTVPKMDVIRELAKFLECRRDVGIVGPKILYDDGTLQLSCGKVPCLHCAIFEAFRLWMISKQLFGEYRYRTWDHSEERDVGWVSGACLMIRRNLFEEVGGFDENFFLYDEDADLCLRVQRHGYRVVYFPKVNIIHLGARSSKRVRSHALSRGYRSKLYYFREHHGILQAEILRIVFVLSSVVKAIAAPLIGMLKGNPEYFSIGKAHIIAALKIFLRKV